jgi:hypothetical protein
MDTPRESRWILYDRTISRVRIVQDFDFNETFFDWSMRAWRYRYICKGLYEFPAPLSVPVLALRLRDQWIHRRAYQYYCRRGQDHGHHVDDWLRAEEDFQLEFHQFPQPALFFDGHQGTALALPDHIPHIPCVYSVGAAVEVPEGVGYIDQLIYHNHEMQYRVRIADGSHHIHRHDDVVPSRWLFLEHVVAGAVTLLVNGKTVYRVDSEQIIGSEIPGGQPLTTPQTHRVASIVTLPNRLSELVKGDLHHATFTCRKDHA